MKARGNLLKGDPPFIEIAMTSAQRIALFRAKQKELGRLKREFYLTDSETLAVKAKIKQLRGE